MEERQQTPVRFNGQADGYEVSVHLDKNDPRGHKHTIELWSRDTQAKYGANYIHGELDLRVQEIYENMDEIHNRIYRSITERDNYLRIDENGTIKIGYLHPINNQVRYLNIPTEAIEQEGLEKVTQQVKVLSRDIEKLKS